MKSILKKLKKPFRNFRKAFYILILNFILLILSNLLDMVTFSCKKKKQNDDNYYNYYYIHSAIMTYKKSFSNRIKNFRSQPNFTAKINGKKNNLLYPEKHSFLKSSKKSQNDEKTKQKTQKLQQC